MGMPKAFTPPEELYIIQLYKDGMSSGAIGRKYHRSSSTILHLLARHGIAARRASEQRHRARVWSDEEKQEIARRWEAGEAKTKIAQDFQAGIAVIDRVLTLDLGYSSEARHRKRDLHPNWRGQDVPASGGYVLTRVGDNHPLTSMRDRSGYILKHRLVMAEFLGRPLSRKETVHHLDGDRANNALSNLQLRMGRHGKGQVFKCACCGSHNIIAVEIG